MNSQQKIADAVRVILEAIGENPDREGLKDTPQRVARMYAEVFSGLGEDPRAVLGAQFEEENHQEMVIVKDISFYSFCEHHLVPFFGRAHVSYIPQGKIVGISKLARLVDVVARRPQVQERMTTLIADTIQEVLGPLGVGVVIEAEHLCMSARGIKKPGHQTVTSAMRGVYMEDPTVRAEFLSLIK